MLGTTRRVVTENGWGDRAKLRNLVCHVDLLHHPEMRRDASKATAMSLISFDIEYTTLSSTLSAETMAEGLDSLFNSPPGPSRPPPPRTPRSPSRTPSPSPRRGRQSSEPLFLSPGQTPIRPRPGAAVDYEPEVDPFEEFENRYRAATAGGAGTGAEDQGISTSGLGAYDPLAPLGAGLGDDDEEPTRKKRKPIPKIDPER